MSIAPTIEIRLDYASNLMVARTNAQRSIEADREVRTRRPRLQNGPEAGPVTFENRQG